VEEGMRKSPPPAGISVLDISTIFNPNRSTLTIAACLTRAVNQP
jgi:hypothetical protein